MENDVVGAKSDTESRIHGRLSSLKILVFIYTCEADRLKHKNKTGGLNDQIGTNPKDR